MRRSLRNGAVDSPVVAVTGASGYIGSYVVAELLSRGYGVHGVVRGVETNPDKAKHLEALPGAAERLTLFDGGDLDVDHSFDAAFADADAVVHTAAMVQLGKSQRIIDASVEGTRNVLRSVDASPRMKRFVHTSSVAAIQSYDMPGDHVFTEADWNNWSSAARGDAYGVAKTEAERVVAAHFRDDSARSSVALNPGVVIGPVMTKAHAKASGIYLREVVFGNKVQVFPSTYVDVRDVASAHVNALERLPQLKGRRFILTGDEPCYTDGALALQDIATRLFPQYRFGATPKVPQAAMALLATLARVPLVGDMLLSEFERKASRVPINFDNAVARSELGIDFRSLEDCVRDGINALIETGIATPKSR